jgi:hypothetical protein
LANLFLFKKAKRRGQAGLPRRQGQLWAERPAPPARFRPQARALASAQAIALALAALGGAPPEALALSAENGPQGIAVQGTIFNAQNQPESASSVVFTIDVRSPGAENCLLYRETQTLNMSGSSGNFSFILGSGARSGSSFEDTSTIAQAFSNNVGTLASLSCANGSSYSPVSGQQRSLALAFDDGFGTHTLSQALNVQSVPFALAADSLQGLLPANFLNLGTTANLTQANVETVFSPINYPSLVSLLAVPAANYLVSGNGAVKMPTDASDPASPATGQIWFNTSSGVFKYYDGTAVQVMGTSSPPTIVSGSAINSGTIGGYTAIAIQGNIQTTGTLSAAAAFLYDHAGAGPGYVGLQVPQNIAASGRSYALVLPNSPGSAGQVMVTDGTGNLTWAGSPSGAVVSVSGVAPISIAGTSQAPIVSVGSATTSSSGIVALAVNGGTAQATAVQGSDSRLSNSRAPSGAASGDLYGTYPSPLVVGVQGVAVGTIPPTASGQVLRFNGSQWDADFVTMFDLRSTVTGSQAFGGIGCAANQTLTWTAGTDNLVCANIGIADAQISYVNQSSGLFFAGPVSGSTTPAFRAIGASDLPAGGYDTSYFKKGGNAFGAAATLGPSDNNSLTLQTNGGARLSILAGGNVGIGTTSPAAALQLKAGAATLAPLMLTAGTNLSTALAGAIEYDGTSLYYTDGTATRRALASVTGGTSSGASAYAGVGSVTGSGTLAIAAGPSGGTINFGSTSAVNVQSATASSSSASGALVVSGGAGVGGNLNVGGTAGIAGLASFNGGATIAANQNLTMSSGTGVFAQTYTGTTTSARTMIANSISTAAAASFTANGLSSGTILSLSSTSTAAAAGNAGLGVAVSGANAAASIARTGVSSVMTSTGSLSSNVAGYFSASGATNNYGLLVANGNVGIGTTSPAAALDVSGHINNSGAAATLGACGASPSIAGNDTRGSVTIGTGAVTSCIVNFNAAFGTAPYCVATWAVSASTIGVGVSASTLALTVSFTSSAASQKFNYHCLQ